MTAHADLPLAVTTCQGLSDALNAPVSLELSGIEATLGRWCWTVPGELCVRVSQTLDDVRAQLTREGRSWGWLLDTETGELTPLNQVGWEYHPT